MPITLTVLGNKVHLENSVVEAAFRSAIAEAPAERGVLVTLASPAFSRIAHACGLGEYHRPKGTEQDKTVYPAALIARVCEILGATGVLGSYRYTPPAPDPRPAGLKLTLRQASHVGGYAKPWVARIRGASAAYRFDRAFVAAASTERGGPWVYYLADGLYEACNRNSKGDERRRFARVEGGVLAEIERAEVEALFPEIAPADEPPGGEACTVECLECGAVYPGSNAHLVDAGGMGCVRCNH